jgi:hypothetical protein
LGWLLLGAGVALLLTAAPAAAEISSVDAYGGQAQVLGKPVRHRVRAQGTTKVQGSNPAGPPASSGSSSAAGAGPGGAKSVVGGGKGNGGGGGVSASRPESSSSAAAGGQSPSIAATEVADRSVGSLSLSGLDVLLLVVIFVGLLGVGVLIRRLARQAG